MPVSEATLSRSPKKPQLQRGIGWSGPSRPAIGICMWPSSPAMPAAPSITLPCLDDPATRGRCRRWPRPTTDAPRLRPNRRSWAYNAAALPSLL